MHFLDAWIHLSATDLIRRMAAPACVVLSILLPGPRAAATACAGIAIAMLFAPDLDLVARGGWVLVWLALAVTLARAVQDSPPDSTARRGGVESGAVGLLLGLALFVLLVAAIARQNLDPALSRDASRAVLLITLGLAHLMLRRHIARAAVAFGAMGLGLDELVRAADAQQLPGRTAHSLAVPFVTAFAIALAMRVARTRLASGGGEWVSGAHDLHD